ncbi:MAG: hypothetical protein AAFU71_11675 [Cyanobacteria bacterium J06632_22]
MWSLWVMVGACAAGCIVLSRPGLITFGTPERRRPSRSGNAGGRLARATQPSQVSQHKAAAQERNARPQAQHPALKPHYPQGQVMAVSNPGVIQQVTPTRAQQSAASKLVSFDVSPAQPDVSVIPAHEDHALDWQEGSLAHKLDVRQNRSLKSFL